MLLIWVTITGLIGVNAFYVLAEFAAVSVRQTQLRPLADRGHRVAGRLLPIVSDPRRLDRYITACQIGITLSSLVLGAYAQATLTRRGPCAGILGASRGGRVLGGGRHGAPRLTTLQVIVGALVPRSLALQFPLRAALSTDWPMHLSILLSSRFIRILNGTGLALLRALRVPEASHRHIHSPEEIDLLIAESAWPSMRTPRSRRSSSAILVVVGMILALPGVPGQGLSQDRRPPTNPSDHQRLAEAIRHPPSDANERRWRAPVGMVRVNPCAGAARSAPRSVGGS